MGERELIIYEAHQTGIEELDFNFLIYYFL